MSIVPGLHWLLLIPAGVLLAVAVAGVVMWIIAGGIAGGGPPSTGVRIWEGLPGSGKSYGVTERVVNVVGNERRPIYTNLPLRLKVLRAYLRLKGGDRLTGYVQVLGEQHFKAFITRFAALARYCEERAAQGVSRGKAEAEFLSDDGEWGPHIPRPMNLDEWIAYRGGDEERATEEFAALARNGKVVQANWIPYGAVIIVDELHKWFDQRKQKDEDPALLEWLSMHRHGMYQIEVMTQDAMQVSLSFRRQCVEYVRCTDKRNLPFLLGYRLPLPVFQYELIPAAGLSEQRERTKVQPLKSWVRMPWLNGGLMWRLYDSFTHCGSMRQLRRRLEESRQFAEGAAYDPGADMKRQIEVRRRLGLVSKIALAVVLVVGVLVMAYFGASTAPPAEAAELESVPAASATRPTTAPLPTPPATAPLEEPERSQGGDASSWGSVAVPRLEPERPSWFGERGQADDRPVVRLGGMGRDYVVIDGQAIKVGSVYGELELVAIDLASRSGVFLAPGGSVVRWSVGTARRVGVSLPPERAAPSPGTAGSVDAADDASGKPAGGGLDAPGLGPGGAQPGAAPAGDADHGAARRDGSGRGIRFGGARGFDRPAAGAGAGGGAGDIR